MNKIVTILNEQGLKVITIDGETFVYLETPTTIEVYKMVLKEITLK